MKRTFFFAVATACLVFVKPVVAQNYQEVEVSAPCPYEQFPSTKDLLRGHGVGVDRNQQFSVEKARAHALNDLASQIATAVDAVMEMTDESWDVNASSSYAGHALQEIKTAVSKTTGYTIVCRKTMAYVQDGIKMMKTVIVVELETETAIKTAYNTLSKAPEVKFEQSYDDFDKTFNEHITKIQ